MSEWLSGIRSDRSCILCGGPTLRHTQAIYCRQCRRGAERMRSAAHRAVKQAIIRGTLLPLATQYCVGCGAFAVAYDHRDYSKPLAVDPVCRSCNRRRGPGQYPTDDQIEYEVLTGGRLRADLPKAVRKNEARA